MAAAAALAFVLFVGVPLWWALRPKPQIANHPKPAPTTMAPERPASSTQPPQSMLVPEPQPSAPPVETPQEVAKPIRDRGLDECKKRQWSDCLWDLQRAREIDPQGDEDPAVQRAWKKGREAMRHEYDDKPPLRAPHGPETPPK